MFTNYLWLFSKYDAFDEIHNYILYQLSVDYTVGKCQPNVN